MLSSINAYVYYYNYIYMDHFNIYWRFTHIELICSLPSILSLTSSLTVSGIYRLPAWVHNPVEALSTLTWTMLSPYQNSLQLINLMLGRCNYTGRIESTKWSNQKASNKNDNYQFSMQVMRVISWHGQSNIWWACSYDIPHAVWEAALIKAATRRHTKLILQQFTSGKNA